MAKEEQRVERGKHLPRDMSCVNLPVEGVGESDSNAPRFSHLRESMSIHDNSGQGVKFKVAWVGDAAKDNHLGFVRIQGEAIGSSPVGYSLSVTSDSRES